MNNTSNNAKSIFREWLARVVVASAARPLQSGSAASPSASGNSAAMALEGGERRSVRGGFSTLRAGISAGGGSQSARGFSTPPRSPFSASLMTGSTLGPTSFSFWDGAMDAAERELMHSFPTAPRRTLKQNNFTRPRPKTPNVRRDDPRRRSPRKPLATRRPRNRNKPGGSSRLTRRGSVIDRVIEQRVMNVQRLTVDAPVPLYVVFVRSPRWMGFRFQGVPSAVWRQRFVEVAHTFEPGSERRRVRDPAPASGSSSHVRLDRVADATRRPATSDSASRLERFKKQTTRQERWPLDGRLSNRHGAYNDGRSWHRSPCIARLVKEQEDRDKARKPDPDCTFKPSLKPDPKYLKHMGVQRPEEVFNRYKVHIYRHFDRHAMYTLEPMRFVQRKQTVDLANSKHAWRVEVEPEEGKDGRGRAYGKALWDDAMKVNQHKQSKWEALIEPSMNRMYGFPPFSRGKVYAKADDE